MDGFRLEVNNLYHYQTTVITAPQNLKDDFFLFLRPSGVLGA